MYTRNTAKCTVNHLFPQLFFHGNFSGTEKLNQDLLEYVLTKQREGLENDAEKSKLATIGGYQPRWNQGFLEEPEDCVKFLKEDIINPSIERYGTDLIKELNSPMTGNTPPLTNKKIEMNFSVNSWTVLYSKGNFQCPHYHRTPAFSGVYFAAVPENLKEPSGALVFHNPVFGSTLHGYDTTKVFMPKEGDLVIFPSWFIHEVYPFDIDQYRLSIVFDVYAENLRSA